MSGEPEARRAATTSAPPGFLSIDASGVILTCDDALLRLLGTDRSLVEGIGIEQMVHPSDHAITVQALRFRRSMGGRGNWSEARLRSAHGWLALQFRAVRRFAIDGQEDGWAIELRPMDRSEVSGTELQSVLEEAAESINTIDLRETEPVLRALLQHVARLTGRPNSALRTIVGNELITVAELADRPAARCHLSDVRRAFEMLAVVGYSGINNVSELSDTWTAERRYLDALGLTAWLAAPLWRDGSVIGFLESSSMEITRPVSPQERDALGAMAGLLSDRIEQWLPRTGT